MLKFTGTFFILAFISALFGFTNIAGSTIGVAQIFFIVFLVLAGFYLWKTMTRKA